MRAGSAPRRPRRTGRTGGLATVRAAPARGVAHAHEQTRNPANLSASGNRTVAARAKRSASEKYRRAKRTSHGHHPEQPGPRTTRNPSASRARSPARDERARRPRLRKGDLFRMDRERQAGQGLPARAEGGSRRPASPPGDRSGGPHHAADDKAGAVEGEEAALAACRAPLPPASRGRTSSVQMIIMATHMTGYTHGAATNTIARRPTTARAISGERDHGEGATTGTGHDRVERGHDPEGRRPHRDVEIGRRTRDRSARRTAIPRRSLRVGADPQADREQEEPEGDEGLRRPDLQRAAGSSGRLCRGPAGPAYRPSLARAIPCSIVMARPSSHAAATAASPSASRAASLGSGRSISGGGACRRRIP